MTMSPEAHVRSCFCLLALLLPLSAVAQPAEGGRTGYVIQVEGVEVLVDLGSDSGVVPGDLLRLYSAITIVHPITKKKIDDRILIGTEKVASVGRAVSLVRLEGLSEGRLKVGDYAIPVREETRQKAAAPKPASCPACEADPVAKAVHEAWLGTVGKPLPDRLEAWKRFLASNPGTPFRQAVEAEIASLAALAERASLPAAVEQPAAAAVSSGHFPLTSLLAGRSATVTIAMHSELPVDRVVLLYREGGSKLYKEAPMQVSGDTAWSVRIPDADVKAGWLEYCIEAVDARGTRIRAFRTAEAPWEVAVTEPPVSRPDRTGRSEAHASFEWVDFYLSNANTDAFWKIEADYAYFLRWGPFRSFRMGFGIFEGRGGSTWNIEHPSAGIAPTRLTISYGYFEPEFSFGDYFALLPRLVVGGVGERVEHGDSDRHRGKGIFGAHAYLRIGRQAGTNLVVGGSFTQEVGIEALAEMNVALVKHFPMGLSASATNLPVGENYGARMTFHVGWKQLDWVAVVARFGVNLRNIRHAGVGGGLGPMPFS
jgi:hypothetical protein